MAPDLFLRLEKRAQVDKIAKSALVEKLIEEWAGVGPGPSREKAKKKTSADKRFIVNADLVVKASSEEDAMRRVGKLLRQDKLTGTPLCADKDELTHPSK